MNSQDKHLQALIHIHRKRLNVLELQSASFGLHVPAHIVTEIETIEEKIRTIEARLHTTELGLTDSDKPYDDLVLEGNFNEVSYQEICLICYDHFKLVYKAITDTSNRSMLINSLYQYAKQTDQIDRVRQLLSSSK